MNNENILNLALRMHEENNKMSKLINKNTDNILNLEMLHYIRVSKALIKELLCKVERTMKYKQPELAPEYVRGAARGIEYKGETKSISQWSKELDIDADRLSRRLRQGWTVERAFTTPIRDTHKNIKKMLETEEYYVTGECEKFAYTFHFPRINKTVPIKHYIAGKYISYVKEVR